MLCLDVFDSVPGLEKSVVGIRVEDSIFPGVSRARCSILGFLHRCVVARVVLCTRLLARAFSLCSALMVFDSLPDLETVARFDRPSRDKYQVEMLLHTFNRGLRIFMQSHDNTLRPPLPPPVIPRMAVPIVPFNPPLL